MEWQLGRRLTNLSNFFGGSRRTLGALNPNMPKTNEMNMYILGPRLIRVRHDSVTSCEQLELHLYVPKTLFYIFISTERDTKSRILSCHKLSSLVDRAALRQTFLTYIISETLITAHINNSKYVDCTFFFFNSDFKRHFQTFFEFNLAVFMSSDYM